MLRSGAIVLRDGRLHAAADHTPVAAATLRVPWADFNLLELPAGTEHENDFTMLSDIFPTGYHGTELAGVSPGTRTSTSAPAGGPRSCSSPDARPPDRRRHRKRTMFWTRLGYGVAAGAAVLQLQEETGSCRPSWPG